MPLITKLALDKTGLLVDNLIIDEIQNVKNKNEIIVPLFGNFFKEGFILKNGNDVVLDLDTDYCFIEYSENISLQIGKEVFYAIVILTDQTTIKLTYQALGGDFSFKRKELIDIYNAINLANPQVQYSDLVNKPLEFKVDDHLHSLENIYGLEFITKALKRIEDAIKKTEINSYNSLLSYIDSVLKDYVDTNNIYFQDETIKYVEKSLLEINKKYFGLDNLENINVSGEKEGTIVANKNFSFSQLGQNKYLTTETLVAMKIVFYKTFVLKQKTGLSFTEKQYLLPKKNSLIQAPNGSTFSFISQLKSLNEEVDIDEDLYPKNIVLDDEITISKITNNVNNNGGILVCQTDKLDIFITNLTTGYKDILHWKKLANKTEVTKLVDVFNRHMVDYGNPHEDTKQTIGLGKVENLPVVNKEDILAIKSVHKYLTFDSLLFFMRTFLLQNGKSFTPKETTNKFIIDNCVVVYTPSGVKCKTKCDVSVTTPPFTFNKITQYCQEGLDYTFGDYLNETVATNHMLVGTYNVNTGNTLIQPIKTFSDCCGYLEAPGTVVLTDGYIAEKAEFIEATISQNDVDKLNMLVDTHWLAEIEYPEGYKIKKSGVWPTNSFLGHYSGLVEGTVNVNTTFRHFSKKTVNKSYSVSNTAAISDANINSLNLSIDKLFLREGETANAEVSVVLTEVSNTVLQLRWKKLDNQEVINNSWLPSTLTINNRFNKINFTFNHIPSLEGEILVEIIDPDLGMQSNPVLIKCLTEQKTTKVVPLYENNVQIGEITLVRNNSTGLISILNVTKPQLQNTSDVYFFRSDLNNNAPIVGVVDVWKDVSEENDWYYPKPIVTLSPIQTTQPPTTTTTTIPPTTTTLAPTIPSTTIATTPTTTVSRTNIRNVSAVPNLVNVDPFTNNQIVVTIDGVNIGSTYEIELYTKYPTDPSERFASYFYDSEQLNHRLDSVVVLNDGIMRVQANANPLVFTIDINNDDNGNSSSSGVSGSPPFSFSRIAKFGFNWNYEVRVKETNYSSNSRKSSIFNIYYKEVERQATEPLPNGLSYVIRTTGNGTTYLFSNNVTAFDSVFTFGHNKNVVIQSLGATITLPPENTNGGKEVIPEGIKINLNNRQTVKLSPSQLLAATSIKII